MHSFEGFLAVVGCALLLVGLLFAALAVTHAVEGQMARVKEANAERIRLATQLHRSNAFFCGGSCCVRPSFRLGERVVGLTPHDLERLRGGP
jgi:hypothetical protein